MTLTLKHIKKLMGWCPNARISEIRTQTDVASLEVYDQSGGEKAPSPKVLSQFSKYFSRFDVRILLPTLFFTSIYVNFLLEKGINTTAFLLGFSLSLLVLLFSWKKQMQQYNNISKKPIIGSFSTKKFIGIFLAAFLLIMILLPNILNVKIQTIYSLIAGILILMWGSYFQLIYWEKKNHMKIYSVSENGFQKTYAIGLK